MSVNHPEDNFYNEIMANARLASYDEAVTVTRHVLQNLSRVLPEHLRNAVEVILPPSAAADFRRAAPTQPDSLIDQHVFIGSLVNRMDTEYGYDESLGGLDLNSTYADDDASLQVRAVFAALRRRLDSGTIQEIENFLPVEINDWWRNSG